MNILFQVICQLFETRNSFFESPNEFHKSGDMRIAICTISAKRYVRTFTKIRTTFEHFGKQEQRAGKHGGSLGLKGPLLLQVLQCVDAE